LDQVQNGLITGRLPINDFNNGVSDVVAPGYAYYGQASPRPQPESVSSFVNSTYNATGSYVLSGLAGLYQGVHNLGAGVASVLPDAFWNQVDNSVNRTVSSVFQQEHMG